MRVADDPHPIEGSPDSRLPAQRTSISGIVMAGLLGKGLQ